MSFRTQELGALEKCYESAGNQLTVIYGRTKSGKTELIKQFCQNKKMVYYCAREASAEKQREFMGLELQQKYGIKMSEFSYDTLFSRIRSGDSSKLVLVIKGADKIIKKDTSFLTALKKLKEKKLYPGPVMIILCISDISWTEQELPKLLNQQNIMLDERFKLLELSFVEVVQKFPRMTVEQCIEIYGITGGVSDYLEFWNPEESVRENVCRCILNGKGPMRYEAERYLSMYLRELSVYGTILGCLGEGIDKLNELYDKTGYSRAKISVYLKHLAAFDVVEKVSSVETGGWDNTRKGIYRIKDSFLAFWYHFLFPHLSDLDLLTPEEFYDTYIGPELGTYLNGTFVKVCEEFLVLSGKMGKLPFTIDKIGTWEGKKGRLDLVAQSSIRESLVGICSWTETEVTGLQLEKMKRSLKQARLSPVQCYLFTAGKFSEDVLNAAKEDSRIQLIDMNKL